MKHRVSFSSARPALMTHNRPPQLARFLRGSPKWTFAHRFLRVGNKAPPMQKPTTLLLPLLVFFVLFSTGLAEESPRDIVNFEPVYTPRGWEPYVTSGLTVLQLPENGNRPIPFFTDYVWRDNIVFKVGSVKYRAIYIQRPAQHSGFEPTYIYGLTSSNQGLSRFSINSVQVEVK